MRLCLLLFALVAPLAASAQPGIPASERQLARLGIAFGPPAASGLSVFSPGAGYGAPCYGGSSSGPYYECGSYAVAFLVDGEYEYDVLTTHTLFLAPQSVIEPYVSGYAGVGYGQELGVVWGTEAGLNLWLTPTGGVTVYGGWVQGERQQYARMGVGLVFVAGP